MARTLWCTLADCRAGYASVGGDVPRICPACDRATVWSTIAPATMPPRKWSLTGYDARLLKQLRIAPD